MQQQVAHAAVGLDGAREGLREMRDTLRDDQPAARTAGPRTHRRLGQAARRPRNGCKRAHEELETRVLERTTALADASREIGVRALQQAAVASLGQRALSNADLCGPDACRRRTGRRHPARRIHGRAGILRARRTILRLLRRPRAGRGAWWHLHALLPTAARPAGYALLAREPVIIEDMRARNAFRRSRPTCARTASAAP